MQNAWQKYHNQKGEVLCNISIYEDIESLQFSHPFLTISTKPNEALESQGIYAGFVLNADKAQYYYYLSLANENTQEDHGWQRYYADLYPNMQEWQSIENQVLSEALEDKGLDLDRPQTLKHKLTFQSEYKKASMIEDLEEEGFEIDQEFMNQEGYHGLYFLRQDKIQDIETLSIYLKKFLKIYDAQYEGWEVI